MGIMRVKTEQATSRLKDIEEELELKNGENNRLRTTNANLEATV